MRKLVSAVFLPAILLLVIFRWRYRILNVLLGNEAIRRMSVNAAMNIPSVRTRLMSKVLRS